MQANSDRQTTLYWWDPRAPRRSNGLAVLLFGEMEARLVEHGEDFVVLGGATAVNDLHELLKTLPHREDRCSDWRRRPRTITSDAELGCDVHAKGCRFCGRFEHKTIHVRTCDFVQQALRPVQGPIGLSSGESDFHACQKGGAALLGYTFADERLAPGCGPCSETAR